MRTGREGPAAKGGGTTSHPGAGPYSCLDNLHAAREPVWPSGKALGWEAEGPRFDPLRLSFLFKNDGLWTLSCDFAHTIMKH